MTRLVIIIILSCIRIIKSDTNESFIATNEWNIIKSGQSIPQGLHVRINLQTGLKEAKLLDNSEKKEVSKTSYNNPLSVLPNALMSEDDEQIKTKYMTYKTDGEIIHSLIQHYNNITHSTSFSAQDIILIFEDLEYLTHQVDNANNFISAHGMEKIILPNLVNQSNDQIRIKNLKLLGVILINNPEIRTKIRSHEINIGSSLIQVLANSKNKDEISSCIFAFGSLLRHFPTAQQALIPKGGASVLVDILTEQDIFNLKIKIKSLILITDLIRDYTNLQTDDETEIHQVIDTEKVFKNLNFCEKSSKFFIKARNELNLDSDLTEKVIQSFLNVKRTCENQWIDDAMFRHTLLVIRSNYENKFRESDRNDDEFISDIVHIINDLNDFLYKDLEIVNELYKSNKDEL